MSKITETIEYVYRNCPIPGGGYVTGFLYHPKEKDLLYLRTDIGGVYRFDPAGQCWISLVEHVKTTAIDETFPSAIAVDPADPEILYIACGMGDGKDGLLCISHDRGESFTYETIPAETEPFTTAPDFLLGDANDDGVIDLLDVVSIRRYIVGGWDVKLNELAADFNQDGIIDLKDVVLIRRYIVGDKSYQI